MDPTKPNSTDLEDSILPNVTSEATRATFDGDFPTRGKFSNSVGPNNKKSTAENLWSLAADLDALHGGVRESINIQPNSSGASGGWDLLAKKAGISQRRVTDTIKEEANESESKTLPASRPVAPADRWALLIGNVKGLSTASSDAKKNDDPPPAVKGSDESEEIEFVADDKDSNVNDGFDLGDGDKPTAVSGNTQRYGKTTKGKVVSSYRDFEDWVKFKKVGAFTYCKNVLLYLMLPATLIAGCLFYFHEYPPCQHGVSYRPVCASPMIVS
jgi:hypothetical protein